MTYRAYRPDRRAQRRRWLLIIVTLAAAIAAVAYLVTRQTEQRGAVEFFAVADQAADLHATAANELESAFKSIGATSRQDLLNRLERIVSTAVSADALLDVEVSQRIAQAYGSLSTASVSWVTGVTEVQRVLVGLMNGDPAAAATTALGAALDELRAGDAAYSLFLRSLDEPVDDVDTSGFGPISYIKAEPADPMLYSPVELILSVSSSYELAPHHNVGVTGQLDPEPVGAQGGVPVVPFSETLGVTAIVTNSGNEDEADVLVTLEIVNADSGASETATRTIDTIQGGASASVVFSDLQVESDSLYQIKITATIDGDSRPEDDTWDIRFIRSGQA
ncbi:MAG: hypothetical protein R2823_02825 [Acidimicrobiia bacterium]